MGIDKMSKERGPMVSVMMMSFNSMQFINDAIESVMNQSFQDFELCITDDNSSDDTWKIINSWKERFPTKIKINHVPNDGIIHLSGFMFPQLLHTLPNINIYTSRVVDASPRWLNITSDYEIWCCAHTTNRIR